MSIDAMSDEPSLQLDHEERSTCGVPGNDVDDAPFTASGERDLWQREPTADLTQPLGQCLVHRRVTSVEEPIQVAAPPEELAFEAAAEHPGDSPEVTERHRVQPAGLHRDHDGARHLRELR
jgi:hypothetical protein